MKNSLLKSALFVWFFWWTILFLFTDNEILGKQALFPSLMNGILLSIIACAVGLAIRLAYVYYDIENIKESIEKTNWNGLKSTLGGLPPAKQHQRAKSFSIPSDLAVWFSQYREKHPQYAAIFEAVLLIYEANPIPASPIKGGHGGLNLKEHSFNVLREILRASKSFSYVGSMTKSGAIRVGLTDKNYQFNRLDPAIPLLGFIHDLGKMNCYKLKNGEVIEIKKNHDVQGSRILTSLPEFIALTRNNQDLKNRLSVIMAYYHHPVEMPLWTDDQTRALTELLIIADNAASKKEGGYKADYSIEMALGSEDNAMSGGYLEILAEGAAQAAETLESEIAKARLEQMDAIPDDEVVVTPTPASSKSKSKSTVKYIRHQSNSKTPGFKETNVEKKYILLGESIFKTLKEEITKNSTLMDASNKNSIGFVKKDLYYFHDIAVRKHLQVVLGDSAFTRDKPGQQNKYSFALLAYLMSKEWLYCIHEGKNYSSKRAYFTIVKRTREDRSINEVSVKYYFIVNEDAFEDANIRQKIGPTKHVITISGPSWGDGCDFNLPPESTDIEVPMDDSDLEFLSKIKDDGELRPNIPKEAELLATSNEASGDGDGKLTEAQAQAEDDFLSFALDYMDGADSGSQTQDNILSHTEDDEDEDNTYDINAEDDDEYIPPDERIGILAVIAKLQYTSNKKLKAVEKRHLNGSDYLYYLVDDVCKKFNYTKDDLSKDISSYREEHGKKKIGTQKLDSGQMAIYIKESEVMS